MATLRIASPVPNMHTWETSQKQHSSIHPAYRSETATTTCQVEADVSKSWLDSLPIDAVPLTGRAEGSLRRGLRREITYIRKVKGTWRGLIQKVGNRVTSCCSPFLKLKFA